MELNENYNAETWLAEWWPIVLANFRVIKNAYDAEVSTRKAVDDTLQTNIDLEAAARTAADDAIANGTRQITPNLGDNTQYGNINLGMHNINLYGGAYNGYKSLLDIAQDLNRVTVGNRTITPNLGMETKIDGNAAEYMFKFLKQVGEMGGIPSLPRFFASGGIQMLSESIDLYPEAYSGFSSLATIAAAVATLNGGDTVDGSVDKKVKDAINAFATVITEDGTINTYKEVLDWIAAHGADFAALVGQVNTLQGMAHTHGNKEVLDGISAADITKWNLIDGIKEFDMQAIYSLYGGLRLLYRLLEGNVLGINLYDGGYVSMTEIERTIDGGNINDTEIRAIIDGGNVTDIIETISFATPAEIIAEWNKEEE